MSDKHVLSTIKPGKETEVIPEPAQKATLIHELQRSSVELTLAYDATIEGFARALDLREWESEGHCLRVTELSKQLARELKMDKSSISHLTRGAFLHDIGKMGIPDSILQKTTPLTDDEKALIRKHPQFAYDLLLPIAYLYPALDIPYCHHEKWNGTGYPQGLKGENIPMAARIFAVVDAWDAMLTIRPYRPAWSRRDVLEFIQKEQGSAFDPGVVDAFLKIVSPTI